MIALDTSVVLAIALGEPETERFQLIVARDPILVGWPTLLESRMVLTGKGFANPSAIIDQLARLPNVTTVAFGEEHYRAAEHAFDRFGKSRIRGAPTPGEVLRGLEQVVVPAWGVGEQCPLRVDHLARAQRPEQAAPAAKAATAGPEVFKADRSRSMP